jgi:hypothetical protein
MRLNELQILLGALVSLGIGTQQSVSVKVVGMMGLVQIKLELEHIVFLFEIQFLQLLFSVVVVRK